MSVKNNYIYQFLTNKFKEYSVKINPQIEINRCYKKVFGELPNLNEPQNLIEKIYWLELNTDTSLWTLCADKYRIREYVEQCGLSEYMPKNYGYWKKTDTIDFGKLPNNFVLKANNGCGTVKVIHDREAIDGKKIKKELKQWLGIPFGYMNAQLHYLPIKPCIIAEELLPNTGAQKEFSPNSLVDYKVWCFKGKPESILVVYDRTSRQYCLDLYDTNWERMPEKLNMNGHFEFRKDVIIPKPECLDEMLKIASKLSEPFPEVRVDFYIVNDKPIIGELTFSTGYGYFTDEYYKYLGDKCDISNLKVIKKKIN